MKLRNLFLPIIALAAMLPACTNDTPDCPANKVEISGEVNISVKLQVADVPASRNSINDDAEAGTAAEALVKDVVVIVYTKPLNGALTDADVVADALYFTMGKVEGQDGMWESPNTPAANLALDIKGGTDYYAMAIANIGDKANLFKGMKLSTLRDYVIDQSWAEDQSTFVMTSVNDNGPTIYNNNTYDAAPFRLSESDKSVTIPTITVQRLAARLDVRIDHANETYNPSAGQYTGVVKAQGSNKVLRASGLSVRSNNYDGKVVYNFKEGNNGGQDYMTRGATYVLSFKARASSENNGKWVTIEAKYVWDDKEEDKVYVGFNVTDQWKTYSMDVVAPAGCNWSSLEYMAFLVGNLSGEFELDDVSLMDYGEKAGEKVVNGDMSSDPFTSPDNNNDLKWWKSGDYFNLSWTNDETSIGVLYPVTLNGATSDMAFLLEGVEVSNMMGGGTYAVPHFASSADGSTNRYFGLINSAGTYVGGVPGSYVVTPANTAPANLQFSVFDIADLPVNNSTKAGYHTLSYLKEYRATGTESPTSIVLTGRLFPNKATVVNADGSISNNCQTVRFEIPIAHRQLGTSTEGDYWMVVRNTIYRMGFNFNLATEPTFPSGGDDPNPDPDPEPDPENPYDLNYKTENYDGGTFVEIPVNGQVSTGGNTPLD